MEARRKGNMGRRRRKKRSGGGEEVDKSTDIFT